MVNEYRQSLETYGEIERLYDQLQEKSAEGEQVESDMINFLVRLNREFPEIIPLEHRMKMRQMVRIIGKRVDIYRRDDGRTSVHGVPFSRGLFGEGEFQQKEGILENIDSGNEYQGPLMMLDDVERMVEAIERRN